MLQKTKAPKNSKKVSKEICEHLITNIKEKFHEIDGISKEFIRDSRRIIQFQMQIK
jgi:hypothetical protein